MKKLLKINLILISLFFSSLLYSYPFFGGFYYTDNYFDKNSFNTNQNISFYLDTKFSDYVKFYTRVTAGFIYRPAYLGSNDKLSNFSFVPNIDLLYFEFKKPKDEPSNLVDKKKVGETNYDLFNLKVGRIIISQNSGVMYGDGVDTSITVKNFKFNLFAITNSFNYQHFFDFIDNGLSKPTFTNWDRIRMPTFNRFNIPGNNNGFIGNVNSTSYNVYFDNKDNTSDYKENSEIDRLNNLRRSAVIAGRVFSGFSFELMQIENQNFSLSFLANIDLIPGELILTYPSQKSAIDNTFAGRYTSFYFTLSASGRIVKGLYYNFEATYETGFNTGYMSNGEKLKIKESLINSFAINTGINYFFNHKTKPTIGFKFMYANGDNDVLFTNNTVFNREGDDNNYKNPFQPSIGYVLSPDFSNIIVFGFNQSIKPLIFLKNEIFSRFFLESVLLIILRPNVNGATFYKERFDYLLGNKRANLEKVFLGVEIDLSASWQIFSDLAFQLQGGVFIPNYTVYSEQDVFWKVGLSLNMSF